MTRREKHCEIDVLKSKYIDESDYRNTRILRLYYKREILSDRKLNNLLKQLRIIKVFSEV